MSIFKNTLDEELERPVTKELLQEYNFRMIAIQGGYTSTRPGFEVSEGDQVYMYIHNAPKESGYLKGRGGDYLFWSTPSVGHRNEWKRITDIDIIYFPSTYTGYKISYDNKYLHPCEQIYVEIPKALWEIYLVLKFEQQESFKIDGQWLKRGYLLDCKNKRDLLNILLTFEDIEKKLEKIIWQ